MRELRAGEKWSQNEQHTHTHMCTPIFRWLIRNAQIFMLSNSLFIRLKSFSFTLFSFISARYEQKAFYHPHICVICRIISFRNRDIKYTWHNKRAANSFRRCCVILFIRSESAIFNNTRRMWTGRIRHPCQNLITKSSKMSVRHWYTYINQHYTRAQWSIHIIIFALNYTIKLFPTIFLVDVFFVAWSALDLQYALGSQRGTLTRNLIIQRRGEILHMINASLQVCVWLCVTRYVCNVAKFRSIFPLVIAYQCCSCW